MICLTEIARLISVSNGKSASSSEKEHGMSQTREFYFLKGENESVPTVIMDPPLMMFPLTGSRSSNKWPQQMTFNGGQRKSASKNIFFSTNIKI